MARTESLQLLGSIVDRLARLGEMSPAAPLRSADWNAVVAAVRDLARLVAARERTTGEFLDERYARADHAHVGQLGLSSFDARTGALIERGVGGAVEQAAAIEVFRADLARVRQAVDDHRRALEDGRAQIDGLRDSDQARARDLGKVSLRVEGLRAVESTVSGFAKRLDDISGDLGSALAFRGQLVDATGAPIDVAGMARRLGELEGLRENLRTADGEIVRIRELESALGRLEERAVDRDDLDATILARLREGGLLDEAALTDSVARRIDQRLAPRLDALDAAAARLDGAQEGLAGRIGSQDATLEQLGARVSTAEGQLATLPALAAQLGQDRTRLGELEARVQTNQAAVADLPALRERLQQVEAVAAGVGGLASKVSAVDARLGAAETQVAAIGGLVTQVQAVTQRLAAIEEALPPLRVAAGIAQQQADQLRALEARVTTSEAQLDDLAALAQDVAGLTSIARTLQAWQGTVETRLTDLVSRVALATSVVERVGTLERTVAEQRVSLDQLGTRVGDLASGVTTLRSSVETVSKVVPAVDALRASLTQLDARLTIAERPTTPFRPL